MICDFSSTQQVLHKTTMQVQHRDVSCHARIQTVYKPFQSAESQEEEGIGTAESPPRLPLLKNRWVLAPEQP